MCVCVFLVLLSTSKEHERYTSWSGRKGYKVYASFTFDLTLNYIDQLCFAPKLAGLLLFCFEREAIRGLGSVIIEGLTLFCSN